MCLSVFISIWLVRTQIWSVATEIQLNSEATTVPFSFSFFSSSFLCWWICVEASVCGNIWPVRETDFLIPNAWKLFFTEHMRYQKYICTFLYREKSYKLCCFELRNRCSFFFVFIEEMLEHSRVLLTLFVSCSNIVWKSVFFYLLPQSTKKEMR